MRYDEALVEDVGGEGEETDEEQGVKYLGEDERR